LRHKRRRRPEPLATASADAIDPAAPAGLPAPAISTTALAALMFGLGGYRMMRLSRRG